MRKKLIMCPAVGEVKVDPALEPEVWSCIVCTQDIWVSRSSRDVIALGDCDVLCNACAREAIAAEHIRTGQKLPLVTSATAAPGFAEEVHEALDRLKRGQRG